MTIVDAAAPAPITPDPLAFLGTGGEIAGLIRRHDWSASPLGPPEGWPRALRDALRLMQAFPQPMWLGWGPSPERLVLLYNDAYRAILGPRHPAALGHPVAEVWPEIWDQALPFVADALRGREGLRVDSHPFVLKRGNRSEETHLSFTLVPVADEDGAIGGLLCGNIDETSRIFAERQLATLAELAERTAGLQAGPAVSEAVAAALATNPRDLPFAILFIAGPEGTKACLATGLDLSHPAADPGLWPLAGALASPGPMLIEDLAARLGADLPTGAWPVPPRSALLLPLRPSVEGAPPAVLAVALNPFRRLDEGYGRFLGLLARRVESTMGASFALDLARARQEAYAALRAAEDRAAFLSELGEALRRLEDPDAVMTEAATRLGQRLGVARCAYLEVESATGIVVAHDWTDGSLPPLPAIFGVAAMGDQTVARFQAGQPVAFSDAQADLRLSPAHRGACEAMGGIRAGLGVPLVKDGRWAAALISHDLRPRDWTHDEQALAREVAERTWSALEAARAARALREGEAFTRDILEASSDCIKVLDLEGRLVFMSGGGQRIMELEDFTPLRNRPWPELWPPESRPLVETAVSRACEGQVSSFRGQAPTAKGNMRFWDVVVSPIRGDNGRPVRLLSISRDITAQRRAEDALRESEFRFREMADSAPVMVWTTQADGRVTYVNSQWQEFTGRPAYEALGRGFRTAVHPEDVSRLDAEAAPALARREAFRLEYRLRRADGTYAWVIDTASPRLSGDGAFLGYTGSVIDITDRKRAEERRGLLVNELNHRVKNTLATVQSLAAQSFRLGQVDRAVRDAFEGRLQALSRAHDVLTRSSWEGAPLREIAERALEPFDGPDARRAHVEGPPVWLPPPAALALAMAFHELATNAAKYGALSGPLGRVDLCWALAGKGRDRRLRLTWTESGGPPAAPPARRGFGSRLIQGGLAAELDGEVTMDYPPSGVICRLDAPLPGEGME